MISNAFYHPIGKGKSRERIPNSLRFPALSRCATDLPYRNAVRMCPKVVERMEGTEDRAKSSSGRRARRLCEGNNYKAVDPAGC